MTGAALERVFESMRAEEPELRLRAFVSATGSAGTIAAGDYLKERLGSLIVAVEAAECPTMLRNGFGEHNIQGIGDKHIPLIHNVLNTDVALAVSDRATDRLGVLFSSAVGRSYLAERCGVPAETSRRPRLARALEHLQRARRDQDGEALRDGAGGRDRHGRNRRRRACTASEHELALGQVLRRRLRRGRGRARRSASTCSAPPPTTCSSSRSVDRERIFNLGYYTWVEQQGVSLRGLRGPPRARPSGPGSTSSCATGMR